VSAYDYWSDRAEAEEQALRDAGELPAYELNPASRTGRPSLWIEGHKCAAGKRYRLSRKRAAVEKRLAQRKANGATSGPMASSGSNEESGR